MQTIHHCGNFNLVLPISYLNKNNTGLKNCVLKQPHDFNSKVVRVRLQLLPDTCAIPLSLSCYRCKTVSTKKGKLVELYRNLVPFR